MTHRFHIKRILSHMPLLRNCAIVARRIWKDRCALHRVLMDIMATRQQTAFLRSIQVVPTNKTLLIFALDDDSIYGMKLFCFLATALRIKGWKIRVLFRNRAMMLGRVYCKAFAINDFVFLEDYALSSEEKDYCRHEAAVRLEGALDTQHIKRWSFEGCWLGPQIIATLSRLRFEGAPDFNDPAVRQHLAYILPQAMEQALRAKKMMAHCNADLALTIEANYSSFGPLVDMAIQKGVDVIQMTQPWKDDGLIFRRLTKATRREHPSSVARETLDTLVSKPWTDETEQRLQHILADRYAGKWFLQARNQVNTHAYTRDQLCAAYGFSPEKKIAVVFSHVLWDANLFYGDDLFTDYGEWFIETVKAACANPSLNWFIKLHPANIWKRAYENRVGEYAEMVLIRREIGTLPPHVKILPAECDISTLSLFHMIDYGVTVRGTSGMELVCFGKPCITAGTGRYSGLGFTVDSQSREEYLHQLAQLHHQPPLDATQTIRAKWHAYAAFILRLWTMKSAKATFSGMHGYSDILTQNLNLMVTSMADINRNEDLSLWGKWAAGGDVDYTALEQES